MITLCIIAKHRAADFRTLVDTALLYIGHVVVVVDDAAEPGILGYREGPVTYLRRALAGDFAAQRNAGLALVRTPWVLVLDTDESMSNELWQKLKSLCTENVDAIEFPHANFTQGVSANEYDWLNWPDYHIRLFRAQYRYVGAVHEHLVLSNGTRVFRLAESTRLAIRHNKTRQEQEKGLELYRTIAARQTPMKKCEAFWRTQVTQENLMSAIDTGCAKRGTWSPFDFASVVPVSVLDLGCGVGRNVAEIRQFFGQRVIGFDVEERIKLHMLTDKRQQYLEVTSDWARVLQRQYHTIVAVHVLQHMDQDLLLQYLADLQRTSPGHRLVLATRWWMDDGHVSIRPLLQRFYTGTFPDAANEVGEFHWYTTLQSVTRV